jgi:hypothetical protein
LISFDYGDFQVGKQPTWACLDRTWAASYFELVLTKPLRQILILLVVTAYIGAAMLQVATGYAASTGMNRAAMGGMMDHRDHPGDTVPCKGMLPGCVSDLGCIFLVSLPAPDLAFATVTAWSSISYDNASRGLRGRTIKPALGPPIPLA